MRRVVVAVVIGSAAFACGSDALSFGRSALLISQIAIDVLGSLISNVQSSAVLQTTSALRYTNVQAYAKGRHVQHITTWGGGSSFDEYAIHPIEMAISVVGPRATSLMRRGEGKYSQLLLNFEGDRTATVNVYATAGTPYAAAVTDEKGTKLIEVNTSKLFIDTAAAVLDFLESGKPNIERAQSLSIRRILDAAATPEARQRFVPLT